MQLYCVYDLLAEEAGPIFEAKNGKVALRMVKAANLPLKEDEFRILHLGYFNHAIPRITAYDGAQAVVCDEEFVEEDVHGN